MAKFTELEKGTLVKNGTEYDYIIEIADDFQKMKTGNVRLRIIEERPKIRKIRTRYDPDIQMYGDKNASMEVLLGYNKKDFNKSLRLFLFTLLGPFYFIASFIAFTKIPEIPEGFLPSWLEWILMPVIVILVIIIARFYFKMNMTMLAEYLKSRNLKKTLEKEGFKQNGFY